MSSIELKKNHSDVGETDIGYNFVGQIGVSTSKELGKESDIVDNLNSAAFFLVRKFYILRCLLGLYTLI